MEGSILFNLIPYFTSFRACNITIFTRKILYGCLLIIRLLFTPIKFIVQDESFVEEEEEEEEGEDEPLPPEECESCKNRGELTYDDIKLVMRSLGMVDWRSDEVGESGGNGKCKECRLVEEVHVLLEEKEASLEELEEAFYVFDRNEDGFISPMELWGVLRRLGWQGMKLEDCERMIRVFDEDGDGRIGLSEFKSLMENAR